MSNADRREIWQIINLIGEPVIRRKLETMAKETIGTPNKSLEDEYRDLLKKAEKLKNEIDEKNNRWNS